MTKENQTPHEMNEETKAADDLAALFVGTGGQFFTIAESQTPLFEEAGSTEEVHDPSDLLESYSEAFQATIKRLKAIRSYTRLKNAGQAIFSARATMNKREFNYLMTEYKMLKEARKPEITDKGKTAIGEFKALLEASADNIKAVGQKLYAMRSDLEAKGLNETEIDALWQLYNAAKGTPSVSSVAELNF